MGGDNVSGVTRHRARAVVLRPRPDGTGRICLAASGRPERHCRAYVRRDRSRRARGRAQRRPPRAWFQCAGAGRRLERSGFAGRARSRPSARHQPDCLGRLRRRGDRVAAAGAGADARGAAHRFPPCRRSRRIADVARRRDRDRAPRRSRVRAHVPLDAGQPFNGTRPELLERYLVIAQLAPNMQHLIELAAPVYNATVSSIVMPAAACRICARCRCC